jgi:glyoxylase-like metal-dependent hydrolase (beta-lactamase superfamily II)
MDVAITSVPLGFCQCYVLRGDGVIVVDAGAPNNGSRLLHALQSEHISPSDLNLVVITHGHWDHIGSAAEIKAATGAKIAMHHAEVGWLENSLKPLSPGVTVWGKILRAMHRPFMPLIDIPATDVNIVLDDEPFSLWAYGIPGQVIHTPGHSPGSVSLLLESGDAFVGDLAMNRLPLRFSPGLPIFADRPSAVIKSWKMLLELGAKMVFPAHGKPFPSAIIARKIAKFE